MSATPSNISIPSVLSVSVSDPSGATGVSADLRTYALLGVYGTAILTTLTAGSTRGVAGTLPVPPRFVSSQLEALLDDATVQGVKVGMLGGVETVRVVTRMLAVRGVRPLVVDPALSAGDGAEPIGDEAVAMLRAELLPLATVLTASASEAGALLGTDAPTTLDEMSDAARALAGLGPSWVLLSGGQIDGGTACVDVLTDGSEMQELRVPRVGGRDPLGAGDTLSAALTALLALGGDVPTAAGAAQRYVAASIEASDALAVGPGRTPLRQLPWANAGQDVRSAMERPRRRWK